MHLLEDENARLKRIVAQQALDIDKGGVKEVVVGPPAPESDCKNGTLCGVV
jgi:hypothetical protein